MCLLIKMTVEILIISSVLLIIDMNPIEEIVVPVEGDQGDTEISIQIQNQECGYKRIEQVNCRVKGGKSTDIRNYPWQISFQLNGQHVCGGSLIEPQWVLTAAHCFILKRIIKINDFEVKAGTHNLSQSVPYYNVSRILVHPLYERDRIANDIALVELKTPIPLRNQNYLPVNTICLPESHNELIANTLTTIGWGLTESGWSLDQLIFVNIPYVSIEQCKAAYRGKVSIEDSMVCAGDDGKDACQGDSGGGLIQWDDKERATIVGIVSFGIGCGEPQYPGVFTRVTSFIQWIQIIIKNHN